MTPIQFEVLTTLFTSGFKPVIWGSDKSGWRIGPHPIPTRTKKSIERQGWITPESSRIEDGVTTERLAATAEARRAFIAAGGNPGSHGGKKGQKRFHLKREK